jgi:hypothetical protein
MIPTNNICDNKYYDKTHYFLNPTGGIFFTSKILFFQRFCLFLLFFDNWRKHYNILGQNLLIGKKNDKIIN